MLDRIECCKVVVVRIIRCLNVLKAARYLL